SLSKDYLSRVAFWKAARNLPSTSRALSPADKAEQHSQTSSNTSRRHSISDFISHFFKRDLIGSCNFDSLNYSNLHQISVEATVDRLVERRRSEMFPTLKQHEGRRTSSLEAWTLEPLFPNYHTNGITDLTCVGPLYGGSPMANLRTGTSYITPTSR
ncbi:hypothetical protein TNCV_1666611, partial [Trichonephila clavipes]